MPPTNLDSSSTTHLTEALQNAYQASLKLARLKGTVRSHALYLMAKAIQNNQDEILDANTLDLEMSREMAIPDLMSDWLKLTPERLQNVVQMLQRLAELYDPIQRMLHTPYQLHHNQTYYQLMPLGVIALVYEALPDLAAIAAGLCLKTGNCLVLKGSSEVSHSSAMLTNIMQAALQEAGMPPNCLTLLSVDQVASLRELVTQDQYLNLVIPYGRASLVQQVIRQATAPVLKTAIGNCYLYWSPSGDLETARWMILDSHRGEPDSVNAIEKVLVLQNHSRTTLTTLWKSLREKGFTIRGDATLVAEFPDLTLTQEEEWGESYLDKIVAFKTVQDLEDATSWINHYSSGHADCVATESYQESHQFSLKVNSAMIYLNTSPRFQRHPKQADAAFLGMSNQKGHRRGLIGLEALTTFKQIIQGNGPI